MGRGTIEKWAWGICTALLLPILLLAGWVVTEIQVTLLLGGILLAMIGAYHATGPVADLLPGEPHHGLIWTLLFLVFISPAILWFVRNIRDGHRQTERFRQYRERRARERANEARSGQG